MKNTKTFNEHLNVAVFTTRFILLDKFPILTVYHHDEDGAWEFVGNQIADEKDYMIVSLRRIIEYDNSILELANLPLGGEAYRKDIKSPWTIKK